MKPLQEKIFNIGLFVGIPALGPEETVRAVRALAEGEIYGIILPWNKRLFPAVEQIHAHFPHILVGIQGPYMQSCQLFASGASFVVDTTAASGRLQIPFFLRQGNDILDGSQILAQCSNKIVSVSQVRQQRWEEITRRAKQAVQDMLGFELRHVGINHPDASSAEQTANTFEQFFGFYKSDKGGAYFAGPYIEAMKKKFHGTHGHIAIVTAHANRAAWYLQQRGAKINWSTADYQKDGRLRVVYLQDEIGGFAVHILQR